VGGATISTSSARWSRTWARRARVMTAATATSKELGTGVLLRGGSGDRGAAAVAHRA
jgi:hypothetical protein